MVLPDNRRLSSALRAASRVSLSSVPNPSSRNNDSSLERPLLSSDSAKASDRLTRNDSPPDRVSTGRCSPAFHRSITTISFRSTAFNAYLDVIPDNWRFAIVMSRSNMVCKAKSLRLFAGITPASFCHRSISTLATSSFFPCSCLFVKFSLSVFILPVSPPLRVFFSSIDARSSRSLSRISPRLSGLKGV